ncbi:MAG: DUF2855 family protein [Gammaproteobacteria bacterium]|nr:DUF2855 family protein [Gammaproteobacteria bacterium]
MNTTDLLVRKDELAVSKLRTLPDTPLAAGQVRVRIEHFALTSNNITYAAFGDAMGYWRFFPTGEDGWGSIPVWGFGSVVQSQHPGVAVGERLYGYFPMASSTVLTPDRLSIARFTDAAPHRAELPAVYNQYFRSASDPLYREDTEALQMLLRPLFITSWLIDDFFEDNDFFGARPGVALLSSASSKTAYGTAFQLHQRPGIEVVGLTSAANKAFCESLGCYHRVLAYEELDRIAADAPCVYIDFAGNAALRRAIHTRFTQLAYSCSIGGTHVDQLAAAGSGKDLPGPRATLFFAPAQIRKRSEEWGADEFGRRMAEAWHTFVEHVSRSAAPWLVAQQHDGPAAVQAAYAQVLAGKGDPRAGHVLSLARG